MNKYAVRTIVCKGCGKEPTERMPSNRKYCSRDCYETSKRPQCMTGDYRECGYCGKQVYKRRSQLGKFDNYFCSREHANKYQGRNREYYICKMCGDLFSWSPSRAKQNNVKYCSIKCRDSDPNVKEMLIKLNAKQQQLKSNKVEIAGYKILDDLGINYIKQRIMFDKFTVDAYIPEDNIVIQFDGEYWHGKPEKYTTLDERQKKRVNLDKSQDAYMKKCGVGVIRFWDSEILGNVKYVKDTLAEKGVC